MNQKLEAMLEAICKKLEIELEECLTCRGEGFVEVDYEYDTNAVVSNECETCDGKGYFF